MKTYQAVKAEIAKLEAKAESLRKAELKSVIAQVRKTIAEYDLTAADLGLGRGGSPKGRGRTAKKPTARGVAKYRNVQTGQTWTGHGRPPAWIAEAKDRDQFLIAPPTATGSKKAPATKNRRPASKAPATAKRGKGARKTTVKARKTRATKKSAAVQIESGVATQ